MASFSSPSKNTTTSFEYLLKTLPAHEAATNRAAIHSLAKEPLPPSLRSQLEFPLQTAVDSDMKDKPFIVCEMNTSNGVSRSPWSNTFYPRPLSPQEGIEASLLPSEKLRAMEKEANELFEAYKELYYLGGSQAAVSSVYFKESDAGYKACFLLKKVVEDHEYVNLGVWESMSTVDVQLNEAGNEATYKLNTTVMLTMKVKRDNVGDTNISSFLSKQAEIFSKVDAVKTPIAVMGRMIEDVETELRLSLSDVYIHKTKDILDSLRSPSSARDQSSSSSGPGKESPSQAHVDTLNKAVMGLGLRKTGLLGKLV